MKSDKVLYPNEIEHAIVAVGELLDADGKRVSIVVIGGAALQLLGIVDRATRDVDIVAVTDVPGDFSTLARPPQPLDPALAAAIAQVAKDFGLPGNWMNRGPANDSRHFRDLIALKCTDEEIEQAAQWAKDKNAGSEYHAILDRVIAHVAYSR